MADEELAVVTDEGAPEGETVVVDEKAAAAAKAAEAAAAAGEDERVGQDEDDALEDADATEAVRIRRREERRQKKERQKVAQDRNQRELRFLRDRNLELERRFSAVEQRQLYSESGSLDDRIYQIDQQIRAADEVMTTAIEKGEGATFTEAQGIRDQLKENRNKLLGRKQAVAKEAEGVKQRVQAEPAAQQQAAQPDPDLVRHAQAWVAKNNWYRADRSDDDSAVVGAIDDRLVQEGWDPTTSDYWTELTTRAKQYLPQRFTEAAARGNGANGGERQTTTERRGPAMANGARERSLRPGEVYVSPERKQAMVDAGVWDDPTLRNRYLKSYASYDKEAGGER